MHQRPKQSPNHSRKMKLSQQTIACSQEGVGPNKRVIILLRKCPNTYLNIMRIEYVNFSHGTNFFRILIFADGAFLFELF